MKPNQPKNRKHVTITEMNDIVNSVTTSRKLANKFGKLHKNILAKITKLKESQPEFSELHFKPVSYIDKKGESRIEYIMTFEGFTYIALGFTGKDAEDYKIWYINQFSNMLKYIKENEIYRVSVDSRNRMNETIKSSGLHDLYGDGVYKEIASLINKMVFNTPTYPTYLKQLAKHSSYKSIRDLVRNDLDREEKMMKFLEEYLYNSLLVFKGDIDVDSVNKIIEGFKSLRVVIQNF